jgi:hypothetical protein
MASPSELSLDCKPHSYSMLLKSFGEQNDQTQKLEEFLSLLEEERLKIDVFKRELPLCMQLLTNGIYIYITSPGFIFLKAFDAFVITTDLKLWIQDYIYIYIYVHTEY